MALLWGIGAVLTAAGAGCGAAASPAQASADSAAAPMEPAMAPAEEAEPDTLVEAFVDLDQAERRLEGALGGTAGVGSAGGPPGPAPEHPGDASQQAQATPLAEGPSPYGAPVADRCQVACEAFGSMKRAAGRLCELAGGDEPRCVRAEERLARARQLVRGACPSCQEAF